MFNSFDYNSGFLKSLEMLKNFKKIVSKKLIRNFADYIQISAQRGVWFQNTYLKDFHKSQIDLGKMNYSDFLKKGRLNLMFYDGSGILENLCNNLPTVAIWTDTNDSLYDHVDDEFIEKYNYLKEAGIIFDNLNQLKNRE